MNVEDIASKSTVVLRYGVQHDWKDTISNVHVNISPGSAETLVRRASDSILCQQNLFQKLPKLVDVHWSYNVQHQCRFFETQCSCFLFCHFWRTKFYFSSAEQSISQVNSCFWDRWSWYCELTRMDLHVREIYNILSCHSCMQMNAVLFIYHFAASYLK